MVSRETLRASNAPVREARGASFMSKEAAALPVSIVIGITLDSFSPY
jgi:hypothetical protein